MNTDKKILRTLTKGDIVLIAAVMLLCFVWFFSSFTAKEENITMKIYLDGEQKVSVSLASLEKQERYSIGGCVICADSEGVYFESSQCSDSLCVKRGRMTRSGDAMACVPERVVVKLYGSESFDMLSY